jgi:hypothetical protein
LIVRRGAGGLRLAVLASACMIAAPTAAQTERDYYPRDRTLSVTERPHPELEPLGLPVGSFLILPSVTAGITYDDNIYALPGDKIGDWIATIGADVAVKSAWSRNAAALHAGLTRNQYLGAGSQSTTDYDLGADGRLDMGDGNVALSAATARFTQSRSDVDAPNAAVRPIRYNRSLVSASGEQELGRVRVAGSFDWRRYRFDDAHTATGLLLDQSFRNRDVTSEDLRVDYALSPRFALYIDAAANQRGYQIMPLDGSSRDSHGYTIEAGADFDITNLMRGHVQLGYLSQRGRSGAWSASGFSGRGKVEWFATPLVTVTLVAGHTVEDSAELDTPAYLSTDVDATIDYELLRSLVITARGGIEWDRFQATDQRARRTQESLGARYRMGRNVVLEASWQHLKQTASGAPGLRGFDDNRLMLTLRLQK